MNKLKRRSDCGLCHCISKSGFSKETRVELNTLMINFLKVKGWYSDNPVYPIAHKKLPPEDAFWDCFRWSPFTEYGHRRRATFRYLKKYVSTKYG